MDTVSSELPRYICHKEVWALKIKKIEPTPTEENQESDGSYMITAEGDHYSPFRVDTHYYFKHKPEAGGYYVVYKDGYKSYSPAGAFEEGYSPLSISANANRLTVPTFGWALKQLHNGDKVCRHGWNGKGMFIFLVPGSTFKVNRAPLLGIYPKGTEINYHAHIDMKTADDMIVPWLASQTDILANDWEVL